MPLATAKMCWLFFGASNMLIVLAKLVGYLHFVCGTVNHPFGKYNRLVTSTAIKQIDRWRLWLLQKCVGYFLALVTCLVYWQSRWVTCTLYVALLTHIFGKYNRQVTMHNQINRPLATLVICKVCWLFFDASNILSYLQNGWVSYTLYVALLTHIFGKYNRQVTMHNQINR
jgi:hypothetical protein